MKHDNETNVATAIPLPGTRLSATLWEARLEPAFDVLRPHLTPIVQRHTYRIGRSRCSIPLGGAIRDYLEGVRLGTRRSWLATKSRAEIDLLCELLAYELIESIRDATEGTASDAGRTLATMMTMWSRQEGADTLLRWWILRCLKAGVSEETFLYVLM